MNKFKKNMIEILQNFWQEGTTLNNIKLDCKQNGYISTVISRQCRKTRDNDRDIKVLYTTRLISSQRFENFMGIQDESVQTLNLYGFILRLYWTLSEFDLN